MTTRRHELLEAIYQAVDDLNLQLSPERRLEKNEDTAIAGTATSLDSLNMVNLIIGVEEHVNQRSTHPVNLLEKFVDSDDGPPETLGGLATLVFALQSR